MRGSALARRWNFRALLAVPAGCDRCSDVGPHSSSSAAEALTHFLKALRRVRRHCEVLAQPPGLPARQNRQAADAGSRFVRPQWLDGVVTAGILVAGLAAVPPWPKRAPGYDAHRDRRQLVGEPVRNPPSRTSVLPRFSGTGARDGRGEPLTVLSAKSYPPRPRDERRLVNSGSRAATLR